MTKKLTLRHYLEMTVMGLLLILAGLSLDGCSKKKSGGPGVAGPAVAGCGVGNASTVTSYIAGGTLTINYSTANNSTCLSGAVNIPPMSGYPGLSSPLTASSAVQTYQYSGAFVNFANDVVLVGGGISIRVLGGGYTYMDATGMIGQVVVDAPSIGFYNQVVSLTH